MRTLFLMRHGKSNWNTSEQDDFYRPLNERGCRAALAVGAHLRHNGYIPDLVICSSSVRTRATLALTLLKFPPTPPPVIYNYALYLSSPDTIRNTLVSTAKNEKSVMMVAHNPGLQAFALSLVRTGDDRAMRELSTKFPTAAVAVIDWPHVPWSELKNASGTLRDFIRPRALSSGLVRA